MLRCRGEVKRLGVSQSCRECLKQTLFEPSHFSEGVMAETRWLQKITNGVEMTPDPVIANRLPVMAHRGINGISWAIEPISQQINSDCVMRLSNGAQYGQRFRNVT
jgi:hypothetical protein